MLNEEESEQNAWAEISKTLILSVILLKLKVSINTDDLMQHVYMV